MSYKLYSPLGNFRGNKVLVTAQYASIPVELVNIDSKTIKDKEFLKKNPLGKIPVLETPEGCLFESNAIIRHLARVNKSLGLYGSSAHEEALVDQWLDFCGFELEPALLQLLHPLLGYSDFCQERNKRALADANSSLKVLDNHLKINNFLVGNKVTIADIALAQVLVNAFKFLFEDKQRKNIANVTRWFEYLIGQDQFKRVLGTVRLCVKEFKPFVGAKSDAHPAKKDAKVAVKKESAPKKPVEKKPKKEEEDEEEEEKPVKSEKNPLDLLPASAFNLFDFKTLYVNAVDKKEALDFLWKNLDINGFSLWKLKYDKAEGEGTVTFMTCNLMNGFLQRLDTFRKYAFGVHGVYGEEPSLEIKGCWLWRGLEHPQEMKDHPSYEYNQFTRLDATKAEDRKVVEEYWTNLSEGDVVEGLKVKDAKYFK